MKEKMSLDRIDQMLRASVLGTLLSCWAFSSS